MAEELSLALFIIFFLFTMYARLSADWMFMVLEDKYPEYYEKVERPSFMAFNVRRAGRADDLLRKAMFGTLPSDFPKDKEIRARIKLLQSLFLFPALPALIALIILIMANI